MEPTTKPDNKGIHQGSDRRLSRLSKVDVKNTKPNKTKPLILDLNRAQEQLVKIAYGYAVSTLDKELDPNKRSFLVMPSTKKSLNAVKVIGDRIRSVLGPNVVSVKPYQAAPGSPGGLKVDIVRSVNVATYVGASTMGGYAINKLYEGLANRLVASAAHHLYGTEEDILSAVNTEIKNSGADESIVTASLARLFDSRITSASDLSKEATSWKDPKILHFSHAASPILITVKSTGVKLQVNKGDPIGYSIDPKAKKIHLSLPAHGVSTPVSIDINEDYVAWLKKSDTKSIKFIESLVKSPYPAQF